MAKINMGKFSAFVRFQEKEMKRNPIFKAEFGITEKETGYIIDRWTFKNGDTFITAHSANCLIACDPRSPVKVTNSTNSTLGDLANSFCAPTGAKQNHNQRKQNAKGRKKSRKGKVRRTRIR